jgi:hypothetical protein
MELHAELDVTGTHAVERDPGIFVPDRFVATLSGWWSSHPGVDSVSLTIATDDRGSRCVALTIDADDDGRISSDFLRAVPVTTLVLELVRKMARVEEPRPDWLAEGSRVLVHLDDASPETRARAEKVLGRPGRQPVDRSRLAEVAAVYRDGLELGAPTRHVAETLHMSHGNASKLVAKARGAGLLPPTTQGRADA